MICLYILNCSLNIYKLGRRYKLKKKIAVIDFLWYFQIIYRSIDMWKWWNKFIHDFMEQNNSEYVLIGKILVYAIRVRFFQGFEIKDSILFAQRTNDKNH